MRKLRYRLGTLAELTKQIDRSKPLAVDFETAGLYGEIQLAQFYQAHWTSALLVPKPDKYALLAVFQTSTIVAHNTCYEVSTLQAVTGFPVVPKSWEDTLLLAKLEFFKAERYSLDLCYIYALGLDPYEVEGIDKKAMQKAPWAGELSEAQLTYAAIDVFYLLDLYDACAKHLDSPVYLLDKAATTHAFKFQCNGLHYNAALGAELMATNQQRLSQLSLPINVNSWKQVRPYIGEDQSTGLDLALFALQGNTQARDVREARKLLKQNSFLTKFEKTSKAGRIYGKFSFTTKSGRGNCKDQNLQQLPRVTKKCFTAEEGNVLVMSDYAQLELRYGCAYVGELAMSELFKAGVDLHQHTADAMKVPRQQAKTCNFNLLYGGSANMLRSIFIKDCDILLPIEDVRLMKKKWHNLWPILTAWQERTTSDWRSGKSQSTILGRNFKSKLYTDAMNLPIQGGSAEVAKLALHKMMKAIAAEDQLKSVQLVNFIHDSFMFECPDDKFVYTKLAELIATSMQDAWLELVKYTKIPDLPMPVDVLVGKNWGNIEYGVDKPLYTLTLEA